jgi:hypothetical protein
MPDTRAYYSVIQYCPDLARAESANVGIVLFRPEPQGMYVRISPTLSRVKRFFRPGKDRLTRIADAANAVKVRLERGGDEFRSVEDLEAYAGATGNDIRLTTPRVVRVTDPARDALRLYSQLVEEGDELNEQVTAAVGTKREKTAGAVK